MFFTETIRKAAALSVAIVLTVTTASAADVKIGTVNTEALKLRAESNTDSGVIDTAYKGEKLVIMDSLGDWFKVSYDYQEGYMFSQYLTVQSAVIINLGTGTVTGSVVNVRKDPNTGSAIVCQLIKGKIVDVIGVDSGWFAVRTASGKEGYIHPDYLELTKGGSVKKSGTDSGKAQASPEEVVSEAPVPLSSGEVSDIRLELVNFAKTFLGVKYKYGGSSPSGFDCSGFAYYVFGKFGYTLNRGSSQQLKNGTSVSKNELLPGDLVFFKNPNTPKNPSGHSGIYIGDGKFIHSSSPGDVVKITPLSDSYYLKNYVGARRIIKD